MYHGKVVYPDDRQMENQMAKKPPVDLSSVPLVDEEPDIAHRLVLFSNNYMWFIVGKRSRNPLSGEEPFNEKDGAVTRCGLLRAKWIEADPKRRKAW